MKTSLTSPQAYLVGAGIASLSAAVFLIRDADFAPQNIHILEQLPLSGGSLDGSGNSRDGYVTRGGRMLEEEAYVCLWNLLDTIPTLTDPALSVKDEIWQFNEANPTSSGARLVGKNQEILDAADLGLNTRDRAELMRLLTLPERVIGARKITDFFSDHFLQTNFWFMWRTTFAFQNWHSAIELKRYFLRFVQEFERIHTLSGVRRTKLNQYDSIVAPIQAWLTEQGVDVQHGVEVTDVGFSTSGISRRVSSIDYLRAGRPGTFTLDEDDLALITLGSMTADATYGDDTHPAELITDRRDGSWRLWQTIAEKAPDFGSPATFNSNVAESSWQSFTLTMRSPLLLDRIEKFSGNKAGSGALVTFTDSSWLMSIVVPHQPHFIGQPADVTTLWGYGLFGDTHGDFVGSTLSEATGQQILSELVGHLGVEDILEQLQATTTVIPVQMPYITSQFAVRDVGDRPKVIPDDATNFAFLGQFTEQADDVVFTVEYSVRTAMHAVYELLGIDLPIPKIYHGMHHPDVALAALRTALG